jgi:hypothetical protein
MIAEGGTNVEEFGRKEKFIQEFWYRNLKRDHLEDPVLNGIILHKS